MNGLSSCFSAMPRDIAELAAREIIAACANDCARDACAVLALYAEGLRHLGCQHLSCWVATALVSRLFLERVVRPDAAENIWKTAAQTTWVEYKATQDIESLFIIEPDFLEPARKDDTPLTAGLLEALKHLDCAWLRSKLEQAEVRDLEKRLGEVAKRLREDA